uniref:MLO-like protein n=1 Tax=Chenopodium quinoa TaxID=63459 RepID=A0A803L855_CHEQI
MANAEETEEMSLEFTPTWVVAVVCFIIIAISLLVERCIHYGGKLLKKKNQKPLFEALQKLKEELMLLGFISLMLTVLQGAISKMCIPEKYVRNMLPCSLKDKEAPAVVEHLGRLRRLLSEAAVSQSAYCASKHKVPFLSVEGLHHLHIFIFVLAVVHVTFSVLTVVFGGARIRQWKHWEDAIAKENYDTDQALKPAVTHVHDHAFIRDHFVGVGEKSSILRWMHSFIKQFYGAVTKADYLTLRMGFIMLLLAVGTKLEHVITELAHEVAEKHVAIEGDLVVKPSDEHFWFSRPQITLFLIHFILFQNAFEIAYFFWIWVQYGFDSCIMGQVRYIVPRLIIGVIIQVLCSYSTLPLYAIVTQMGSNFKKAIFDEHVQAGILGWREKVKKKKGLKGSVNGSTTGETSTDEGSATRIQMARLIQKGKEGNEIQPSST